MRATEQIGKSWDGMGVQCDPTPTCEMQRHDMKDQDGSMTCYPVVVDWLPLPTWPFLLVELPLKMLEINKGNIAMSKLAYLMNDR